jgi:hypothetical protein
MIVTGVPLTTGFAVVRVTVGVSNERIGYAALDVAVVVIDIVVVIESLDARAPKPTETVVV